MKITSDHLALGGLITTVNTIPRPRTGERVSRTYAQGCDLGRKEDATVEVSVTNDKFYPEMDPEGGVTLFTIKDVVLGIEMLPDNDS